MLIFLLVFRSGWVIMICFLAALPPARPFWAFLAFPRALNQGPWLDTKECVDSQRLSSVVACTFVGFERRVYRTPDVLLFDPLKSELVLCVDVMTFLVMKQKFGGSSCQG
jgi:hypothetical protein